MNSKLFRIHCVRPNGHIPSKNTLFFLPQYVLSVGEFILVKDGVDITKSINYDNLQPATMTGSIIIKLSQGNRVSDVLSTVFLVIQKAILSIK